MTMMRELSSKNTVPSFARGMSILVVDYDTTSLMYLASLLEQYSYKVTTTEVASVALSMIRENEDQFKLVIANINMADMDCLSFLRVLHKKDIPVILLASKRNAKFAQRALAEGASFFLEQPISSEDLKYIWQHIFKTYTLKGTGQKEDHGKAPEQAVESNSQAGGSVPPKYAAANNVLHGKKVNNYNEPKEAVEAVPANTNRVRGSLMSTFAKEYPKESLKQEGSLKTKRLLINDDQEGNQKGKKFRSNFPSQAIDLSNIVKPFEYQMKTGNNEMNETNKNSYLKRNRRILWTVELHRKFIEAVGQLGDEKARPTMILKKMNVPNLTQRQVASHLQKYKAQVQKISDAGTTTVPSAPSTLPHGPLFGRSTTRSSFNTYDKIKSLNSQPAQRHYVNPGKSRGLDLAPGQYSLFNAGKSIPNFTEKRSFEVKSMTTWATPADAAPPACLLNQNLQPSLEYSDLMKLLDEEEEVSKNFGNEPNPGEVDRFCEWLNDALLEENKQPLMEASSETMEPLNTPEVEGPLHYLNYGGYSYNRKLE